MIKYNILILLSVSILFISCGALSNVKKDKVKSEILPSVSEEIAVNPSSVFKINSANVKTEKMLGSRSLGNAQSGEVLSDRFAILNDGDKVVVILDVTTGCACLKIDSDRKPMKKGEKSVVNFTYDTKGKKGSQFSELKIKTNIGDYIVLVDLFVK